MKPDLYGALGVSKDADPTQIKAAFKTRAKTTHPDQGGNPEDFGRVKQARDVLCNPQARARYDATGEIPSDEPDTLESRAMAFAYQTVNAILGKIEQRGGDPAEFDLIGDCERSLKENLAQLDEAERKAKKSAEKIRKTARLFKAKRGKKNLIGPMLEARAAQFDAQVAKVELDRPMVLRAKAILADHTFDRKAPPPRETDPYARTPSWFALGGN